MNNKNKIIKIAYALLITILSFFLIITMFLQLPKKQFFGNKNLINNIQKNDKTTLNKSNDSRIKPSSSIETEPEISLPQQIFFAISSLDKIIPEDPKVFPKDFEKFFFKLLKNKSWISFNDRNNEFSIALQKIYKWYLYRFKIPYYAGNFPIEAKRTVLSETGEIFNKINGVPENSIKIGSKYNYIFPEVKNVLDEKYGLPSGQTQFPNLKKFDYKILSIDTNNLKEKPDDYLWLQYSYNKGQKYNIYIRNKENELTNKNNNIEQIFQKGCIIIRSDKKKYQRGDKPIKLSDINLSVVKSGDKIEFYTSIIGKKEKAQLIIKNKLPDAWENNIEIGILDHPINPWNIKSVIRQGGIYSMIPTSNVYNNLLAYSEKSDYINDKINRNITFYMGTNEKIIIPIFYKNKQIQGSSNLVLKTNDKGVLEIDKKTLKIPSDDYDENVKPAEIKHRTELSRFGKRWTEVKITTDDNIIIGSKKLIIKDAASDEGADSEFNLRYYNALQKDIIFEKPWDFKASYQTKKINYAKIFDTEKLTKKMIGELYYDAWGINRDKYNYKLSSVVRNLNKNIVIPQLPKPVFKNNGLDYSKTKQKQISPTDAPVNNNLLIQNNFGNLLQDINDYYNNLNAIIKMIMEEDISLLKGHNFLKPSKKMQEYKFVENILLGKNINNVVKNALDELEIATEAFVNGSNLLPEKLKKIPNIMKIKKNDKQSWARFALPRIIKIILNRYQTVFSEFENALLKYKYNEIISKLLTTDKTKINKNFIGIRLNTISKKTMKIGTKKQNMLILAKDVETNNFNNFKEQLKSVLNYFNHNPKIVNNILRQEDSKSFLKKSSFLLDSKWIINNKKEAYKQIKFLFQILDFYIRKKNHSLQKILDIGYFIKDDRKRLHILIDNFNSAVSNLLQSKKIYVSAYAFKALVEDRLVEVAAINIKKIFDSFLNKYGLSIKEKEIITSFKNFDYTKKPNKLFEIAIKIEEFNFGKFLNDITGNNINRVANKILNLDPTLQLPSNLPPESKFADIIKNIAKQPNIIYIILGVVTSSLGMMIAAIGILNKKLIGSKMRIIISIGLIAVGIITIMIVFILPSIGSLSMLIK